MDTFSKAIELCFNSNGTMLMTPLCRAVYARDSIIDMMNELGITEVQLLKIINESTTSGDQHLTHSDVSCAVASMIAASRN